MKFSIALNFREYLEINNNFQQHRTRTTKRAQNKLEATFYYFCVQKCVVWFYVFCVFLAVDLYRITCNYLHGIYMVAMNIVMNVTPRILCKYTVVES